jgi:outer membrane lipoprotein SlyB
MSILVWFTMGVALWHFTVFLPDRFWGGIVGAFLASAAGAMVSGAIAQIALGKGVGDTDLATALYAVPGCVIGLAIVYAIGVRSGVEAEHV